MSEKDKVVFQINKHLFEQLTEWQDKMEEADESEAGEPTKTETHPNTYEQHSKTDNS